MNPDAPKNPRSELEAQLTDLIMMELPSYHIFALCRAIEQDTELSQLYNGADGGAAGPAEAQRRAATKAAPTIQDGETERVCGTATPEFDIARSGCSAGTSGDPGRDAFACAVEKQVAVAEEFGPLAA